MTDKAWKKVERRIAALLGGERVPLSGSLPRLRGDVQVGDWLVVEVKHRRRLPRWLTEAVAKVRRIAGPNRLGIVVLHEHGRHDSLVVLSLKDWREWHGEIQAPAQNPSSDAPGGPK